LDAEGFDSGPSIDFVNEVVLKKLRASGITLTSDCRVTNDQGLSAADFVSLLTSHGWSWPPHWYRRNLNYFQHYAGAVHLEKEVEKGRWIHIVVTPGVKRESYFTRSPLRRIGLRREIKDWSLPPKDIELHAESGWLRPSSYAHLWRFLKETVGLG
jgi:hypothetical protein